ncbi:MAG: hypothetical protein AB4290_27030 [Spirulina sp.]
MKKSLLAILVLFCAAMLALATPASATEIPVIGHGMVDVGKYHGSYQQIEPLIPFEDQPWWDDRIIATEAAAMWWAKTGETGVQFCFDLNENGGVDCVSYAASGRNGHAELETKNKSEKYDYALHDSKS